MGAAESAAEVTQEEDQRGLLEPEARQVEHAAACVVHLPCGRRHPRQEYALCYHCRPKSITNLCLAIRGPLTQGCLAAVRVACLALGQWPLIVHRMRGRRWRKASYRPHRLPHRRALDCRGRRLPIVTGSAGDLLLYLSLGRIDRRRITRLCAPAILHRSTSHNTFQISERAASVAYFRVLPS